MRLYVNIDHVATVRQARRANEPDPVRSAVMAELGGADGITVHLREDRRHIQDRDVRLLLETARTGVNLELAASSEILELACDLRPLQATLVPENREEVTTEGGLDFGTQNNREAMAEALARLNGQGVRTSLFIDPSPSALENSKELGAQAVELHTGEYANARGEDRGRDAGHGLTYENVIPVAAIPEIEELNIGHSIISRAIFIGLEQAVREMGELIRRAPQMVEEPGAWLPPIGF